MVVEDAHASFEALSTERTAASFTEQVGLQPTTAREIGEPRGECGRGKPSEVAVWSFTCDGTGIEPLDDALLSLLNEFDGREGLLDELRNSFEMRVRCYASSDSEQGGFWLSAEVMRSLGRLGVDFHCTVYLSSDDVENPDIYSSPC